MKKLSIILRIALIILVFMFLVSCKDNPGGDPSGNTDDPTPVVNDPELIVKETSLEMFVGEAHEVEYEVKNFVGFTLEYSSSDSSIASIDKGVITANKPGNAVITIKVSGLDLKKDINVTVKGVTKLTLKDKNVSINIGETYI